mmetsp:Transcript_27612/g.89957  ORF Transcript_27612/g.89957 Transcript_27612/m.89957 type:complete len:236 (-) Transcript_27612:1187-1894(-)
MLLSVPCGCYKIEHKLHVLQLTEHLWERRSLCRSGVPTALHELPERSRAVGGRRRTMVLGSNSDGYLHLVHVAVRKPLRVNLPEDDAEAVNVHLAVVPLAPQHLWGRVLGGPDASRHRPRRVLDPSQPEVCDLDHKLGSSRRLDGSHQEVAGLEVAVDDAHGVKVSHTLADASSYHDDRLRAEEGLGMDKVEERSAGNKLSDDADVLVVVDSPVEAQDMRVIKHGENLAFFPEVV